MKITNVRIAHEIAKNGYDFSKALEAVDEIRTLEEENEDIPSNELYRIVNLISNITFGLSCEREGC